MVRMLSANSTVVAAKGQVSCELGDEAVILDVKAGIYYGLNPVGARIWDLIQEPRTVDQIRNAILQEYEIDLDSCERDLRALLEDLAARELVRIDHGTPA
jgi:Coenzyme PQQ synthesis protein D (PqqD)